MKPPRSADEMIAQMAGVSPSTVATWRRTGRLGAAEGYQELDATLKAEASMADLEALRSVDEIDVEDMARGPEPLAALDDLIQQRSEHHLRAQLAAHVSWAKEEDPSARTKPARDAFFARFEREVDPDGTMDPVERGKRAEHLRKAHMLRMSLASAKARREKKQSTP
jgi:hypothetical protein